MDSPTGNDVKAEDWLNDIIAQLKEGQDFKIFNGSSKPIMKGGEKVGIKVSRPHIKLFSTGITGLYLIANREEK
jgi:hypothetical protein